MLKEYYSNRTISTVSTFLSAANRRVQRTNRKFGKRKDRIGVSFKKNDSSDT